jgi:hypothetical protein
MKCDAWSDLATKKEVFCRAQGPLFTVPRIDLKQMNLQAFCTQYGSVTLTTTTPKLRFQRVLN